MNITRLNISDPPITARRASPTARPYHLFSDAAYLSLCDALRFPPEVRKTIRTETLVKIVQCIWFAGHTTITPNGKSYLSFDLNGLSLIAFDEKRSCRAIDVGLHDEAARLIGISPEPPHRHRFTFPLFGGRSVELD
jgi:hypothetical protein